MAVAGTLIDATTLAALPPGSALIVDCRYDLADPEAGLRAYRAGHVPGAVYAHLDRDLSDLSRIASGLGRHPLPDAAAFLRTLRSWGWRAGLPVVAYDMHGGALGAARLWWMLRQLGHPAAVLDGGWQVWIAAGLPQRTRASGTAGVADESVPASVGFDPHGMVDSTGVQAHLHDGALCVVDARAPERYRGEVEPIDPVAGHIPGSINRPFVDNLAADGCFKSAMQLRDEWRVLLGNRDPASIVHSCGSGVSACQNLLAMEYAGLHGSRLYPASWSGWVSDRSRPVEKS